MSAHINVKEVLEETLRIMLRKPVILLPMVILWLFDRISGILARPFIHLPDNIISLEDLLPTLPSLLTYLIVSSVLIYIMYAVIEGIYPLVTKNILENRDIDLIPAIRFVLKRASTLITAGILIGIIVFAGLLLFIIPGVIFAIWYFYTVPFIVLENRGVLDAMGASKAFASNKRKETIYLFSVPFIMLFLGGLITETLFIAIPGVYMMMNIILDSVIFTWFSVIPAYVYLKYYENENPEI